MHIHVNRHAPMHIDTHTHIRARARAHTHNTHTCIHIVIHIIMYFYKHLTAKTYPLVTATTGVSYNVDNPPPSTSASSQSVPIDTSSKDKASTASKDKASTASKDKASTTNNVPSSTATAVVKTITHLPLRANKGICKIDFCSCIEL